MADGMFEQMYGTIKVSGNVVNGMKDGAWVETHSNTELPHYIIHFKEDKKDGLYLEFDKYANIIKKIDYKNDVLDGYSYSWNRGGKIASKQGYKEGQLDGPSVLYTDKGFIQVHDGISAQGNSLFHADTQGMVQGILGISGDTTGDTQDQGALTAVDIGSSLSPARTADDGIGAGIHHRLGDGTNILKAGNSTVKQAHIQGRDHGFAVILEDSSHSDFLAAHNTHCRFSPF